MELYAWHFDLGILGVELKTQRNLIYIFSVVGVVSIVGYIVPLDPIFFLSADQANDILIAIFGGAFVGIIVAYLEYRDRLYALDQQFYPQLVCFLHLLCALETLNYSAEQKNAIINYFKEKDSNEFRQSNSVFGFLPQDDSCKKRLIALLGISEDGLFDFESSIAERLLELSKRYLDFKGFNISLLVRLSHEYGYLITQLAKQRMIDRLVESACSYYQLICNQSDFGQFNLFASQCEDSSLPNTLIAERDVSGLWFDNQSSGCNENGFAYEFFVMFIDAARSSEWLERCLLPSEPFWETRCL